MENNYTEYQQEEAPEQRMDLKAKFAEVLKNERNVIRILSVLLAVTLVLLCVMSYLAGAAGGSKDANAAVTETNTQEGRPKMDTVALAEYVQQRTVTVNVDLGEYGSTTGSGFFIDDQGTVVTSYHVIDGAHSITVEVSDGGTYNMEKIIENCEFQWTFLF